jgi:hypothetical protein
MMPQSKRWSPSRPRLSMARAFAGAFDEGEKQRTVVIESHQARRVASSRQLCSKLTHGTRHFFHRRIAKSEDQPLA